MTDVYQPATDAAPEAPAETVHLESREQWDDQLREAGAIPDDRPIRPGEGFEKASDEVSIREAMRDAVQRRAPDSEFNQPPLVEVRAAKESYKDAGEAAKDLTFTRRVREKVRLMQEGFSETDAEAVALRGEDPPERIGVVDRAQNKVLDPLHDEDGRGRPIKEDDSLSLHAATRMQGDFREELAKYQADLFQRLQGQAPDQTAPTEAAPQQIEAQPSQPSPEVAAQAEAINQQRQILASQAAYVNAQAQSVAMSAEEKAIRQNAQRWVNHLKATYPEANSPQQWVYTQQTNPKRAAEINKGFAHAKNVLVAGQNRLNELNELRQGRAERFQRVQEAALDQRNSAWDDEAYKFLQTMPEFTQDKAKFRREVTKYLKEVTGYNDAQLSQEWHTGNLIRPPGAQKTIALAVRDRIRQEATSPQRLARHRARVPQPQAPGVWQSPVADYSAEIAAAQRRLQGARGERASVMAAADLTKLMRQAGRLSS